MFCSSPWYGVEPGASRARGRPRDELGGGNECCWLLIASTRQHLSDPAVAALTLPSFLPPQERLLPLCRGEGSIPSCQDMAVC